jgi:UDP-N-acetylglucosamine 2-epimerase
MNLDKEVEQLIRDNITCGSIPSNKVNQELQYFHSDIPEKYKDYFNVKLKNTDPILLYYYIDTNYAEFKEIRNLSAKLSTIVEKYTSIELENAHNKSNKNNKLGFQIKLTIN